VAVKPPALVGVIVGVEVFVGVWVIVGVSVAAGVLVAVGVGVFAVTVKDLVAESPALPVAFTV